MSTSSSEPSRSPASSASFDTRAGGCDWGVEVEGTASSHHHDGRTSLAGSHAFSSFTAKSVTRSVSLDDVSPPSAVMLKGRSRVARVALN